MDILEHTTNWYKGEIFDANLMSIAGGLLLIISIFLGKFGKTPNAQALVIPLIFLGVLFVIAGIFGARSNAKTLEKITNQKIENDSAFDELAFIKSERKRVENFQPLYTYTKIGAGVCFALALLLFFITTNRHGQAIALVLVMIGLSGLTIDYFSKERADVYYEQLSSRQAEIKE